jgi:hypothetical protein
MLYHNMQKIMKLLSFDHSYDILGAGMLWKPKDLHKIH